MIPILPPVQIIVLFDLQVSLTLYVIPKRISRELEGLDDNCPLSKLEHLEGHRQARPHLISPKEKPLGSPHG